MQRRLALAGVLAVASFGAVAAPAGAAGSICSDIQITINGQQLVNDQQCNALPLP